MDKTFDEAIAGVRTAERGVDVREDIAQGMEYVKQCAENSAASANAAASSATQAEESATAADGFAAAANRSAQDAKKNSNGNRGQCAGCHRSDRGRRQDLRRIQEG